MYVDVENRENNIGVLDHETKDQDYSLMCYVYKSKSAHYPYSCLFFFLSQKLSRDPLDCLFKLWSLTSVSLASKRNPHQFELLQFKAQTARPVLVNSNTKVND